MLLGIERVGQTRADFFLQLFVSRLRRTRSTTGRFGLPTFARRSLIPRRDLFDFGVANSIASTTVSSFTSFAPTRSSTIASEFRVPTTMMVQQAVTHLV